MLVKVVLENWMSFRDRVELSMLASKERQHRERSTPLKKFSPARVLPVAAIYGGNASGKSNFFKGIAFAKELIINGSRPGAYIPVQPFCMDEESARLPTRFTFQILIEDALLEYSFAVTKTAVVEEKLTQLGRTNDKTLFLRKAGDANLHLGSSITEKGILEIVFQGTQDNQLFLTNTVMQKKDHFKKIYDWFGESLQMIAPNSKYAAFEHYMQAESSLNEQMAKIFPLLDTGVQNLGAEGIPVSKMPFPKDVVDDLGKNLQEGECVRVQHSEDRERYLVSRINGELKVEKLVTYHAGKHGKEYKMDMPQESDGSLRVIDLLPAFIDMAHTASQRVYVIDELDRSLHTLLTRKLLESFLASRTPEGRSQILFTTHDVLLMDQDLLRRDEMWVMERGRHGGSSIIGFSEYEDIRYDKDIRKSYLQGRLGGIPRLSRTIRLCGRAFAKGGATA